jgi:hypothetical protein
MEKNVEKIKVRRIAWPPSLVQIMTDQKHFENVEYLNYLGNMKKIMQGVHVNLNRGLLRQKQYSRGGSFHQQIGFKCETCEVLHVKHSFV